MLPEDVLEQAAALVGALKTVRLKLATAESCTGGLVAAAITDVPGSSAIFERGFVTYSNEAKTDSIGVASELIEKHGAVSAAVAAAMAEGALRHSRADVAVAITGIAGPGGATAAKPVGLVYLAVARTGSATVEEEWRFGDTSRRKVRESAVRRALALVGHAIAMDQA